MIPGLGRYPREGNDYTLQDSVLESFKDCIVHGVTKSQTQLSNFHFPTALYLTVHFVLVGWFLDSISSVQSLSRVQLFAIPWTAAHQAFLSITNCQSLLKLMSIESVMPSNHLILCRSLFLPPSTFSSIRVFSVSQFFASDGQSNGVSASTSVFSMNIQD